MDGADGVYPASEDTYLLIDTLEQEFRSISKTFPSYPLCIEIGVGSGEVTQMLSFHLPSNTTLFATDVNELALHKTRSLLSENHPNTSIGLPVQFVQSDLFSCFHHNVKFNVVVFNPPYVPTDGEELSRALRERDISASWAGGRDGRHVIDQFVRTLPQHLATDNGVAYLVVLQENNPEGIKQLALQYGMNTCIVAERRAGIETLYIMKFSITKN